MQETKMTPTAMGEVRPKFSAANQLLVHGKPCRTITRTTQMMASGARGSAKGGVAAVIKEPRKPVNVAQTDLTKQLIETGRWVEVVLLAKADASHFGAANLYGVSGANGNPRMHRQNEALLAKAIMRFI